MTSMNSFLSQEEKEGGAMYKYIAENANTTQIVDREAEGFILKLC